MPSNVFHLFVLIGGDEPSQKTTKSVINWVRANLRTINEAGVKIFIEKVKKEDLKDADVLSKLNKSYGVTGFPALFIPPSQNDPKPSTYNGWSNIQQALTPIILAGQRAARNQISQIASTESDFEKLLKSDMNFDARKSDSGREDSEIGGTLTPMDIQKQISRFNSTKTGHKGHDTNNSAIEEEYNGQKNDNVIYGKGNSGPKLPANTRPPMSSVPTASDAFDDDNLMSKFMEGRIEGFDLKMDI